MFGKKSTFIFQNRPNFSDERHRAELEQKSKARLPDNPNINWSPGFYPEKTSRKRKTSLPQLSEDEHENRRDHRKQSQHDLESNVPQRRRRQSSTERMADTLKQLIAEDEQHPQRLVC